MEFFPTYFLKPENAASSTPSNADIKADMRTKKWLPTVHNLVIEVSAIHRTPLTSAG